jgi:hypothetical protein
MLHRHVQRRRGARTHHVKHGFGLAEVKPAVQEGAQRELTASGRARAAAKRQFDHGPQRGRAAMTVDLEDVLGGVGVGGSHVDGEHLVHAPARRLVDHVAVDQVVRRPSRAAHRPHQRASYLQRTGTAEAHDTHAALPGRRGDGDDRIGSREHRNCQQSALSVQPAADRPLIPPFLQAPQGRLPVQRSLTADR